MAQPIDDELRLRQVLRIYRNACVGEIRQRLRKCFGDEAEDKLAAPFGKTDEETGKTQWAQLKENAVAARAAPEVSTTVEDEFEVLGVAQLYSVCEKYFDELFPKYADADGKVRKQIRQGLLRCIKQITVLRDPNSHEVTQPIDREALLLSTLNAINVVKLFDHKEATKGLRDLLREFCKQRREYSTNLLAVEGTEADLVTQIERLISAHTVDLKAGFIPATLTELDSSLQQIILSRINVCLILTNSSINHPVVPELIHFAVVRGRKPVCLLMPDVEESKLGQLPERVGAPEISYIRFYREYADEAIAKVLARMIPSHVEERKHAPVSLPAVAKAVANESLQNILVQELRNPELSRAWLVSPFASDHDKWSLFPQPLSVLLATQLRRGAEITLVTRPPDSGDGGKPKRQFLDALTREGIKVLVNHRLHAKIYLFETDSNRCRWLVGSHNLTESGLTRWKDVSMDGSRREEYSEAKNAANRIEGNRDTLEYGFWQARNPIEGRTEA